MDEVFKNIDLDKRDRIINSALEEFSKNSFAKASTNNIIKNAGISKGLLYHYFKSKKNLYNLLEVFVIETVVNAILNELDWEEADLFLRIKQIVLIKLRVFTKYPYLVSFSKHMYENKSVDEMKEMVESYVPDIYHQIYHKNIDFTLFKDSVDVERAIKMTQWTLEKLSEEWTMRPGFFDDNNMYEKIIDEIDIYLDMLKETFYKN